MFTAGVGEHAAEVRESVCNGLECLGLELDPRANSCLNAGRRCSQPHASRGRILVITTREDMVMLQEVVRVLETDARPNTDPVKQLLNPIRRRTRNEQEAITAQRSTKDTMIRAALRQYGSDVVAFTERTMPCMNGTSCSTMS